MNVDLNEGQQECLKKLITWWKKGSRQLFEISGAAGTGKTTIIKYLIDAIDSLNTDNVLFVALVGKAAMQMTKSGVMASTIHSAIYHPIEVDKRDENGKPIIKEGRVVKEIKFVKKKKLDGDIKLIVVDEAPMVDKKVAKDLFSFEIPIIALGDLHQLPPVFGDPVFLQTPDHTLTQIMRQKEDNPILELSQHIIHDPYIKLNPGTYQNKLMIIKRKEFFDHYLDAFHKSDIVICGRNSTRDDLNTLIRKKYYQNHGVDLANCELPEILLGDKLICRKNNWNVELGGINLINGLVGYVTGIDYESKTKSLMNIDFRPEFLQRSFENLPINLKYFFGDRKTKDMIKSYPHTGELFEFGYAITCHLSQGSQYEKVIVLAERLGDNEFYRKWLYTAVTRASDKLILII